MPKSTKFKPGQSGNPAGRPRGIKDRRVILREAFKLQSINLIERAIEMALSGDVSAMKMCLDRIVPPIKEDPIQVTLPKITGPDDCGPALSGILSAVAAGDMLPSEGQILTSLIEAQRRAFETGALAERLANIERLLTDKGVEIK